MNLIIYALLREGIHFLAAGITGLITYLIINDKVVAGGSALWIAIITHLIMDVTTSV